MYHQDIRAYLILANPLQPKVGARPCLRGMAEVGSSSTGAADSSALASGSGRCAGRGTDPLEPAPARSAATKAAAVKGHCKGARSYRRCRQQPTSWVTWRSEGQTAEEVLGDQASLQAASCWCAGGAARKLTAVLARLTTSVQSWTSLSGEAAVFPWSCTLRNALGLWCAPLCGSVACRTTSVELVEPRGGLAFWDLRPGTGAVFSSCGRPHGARSGTVRSTVGLACRSKDWLTAQLSGGSAGPPPLLQAPPGPQQQSHVWRLKPRPPARPLDLVTLVLLAWNVYQGLPVRGGAGVPGG